jgi:hypothetical protein
MGRLPTVLHLRCADLRGARNARPYVQTQHTSEQAPHISRRCGSARSCGGPGSPLAIANRVRAEHTKHELWGELKRFVCRISGQQRAFHVT